MPFTDDQIFEILEENKKIMSQQAQLIQMLVESRDKEVKVHPESRPELTIESLANTIEKFNYDPEAHSTFEMWYDRYSDIFTEDAKSLDDPAKVRLLLRKLDTTAHDRYADFILPAKANEKNFSETVEILKKIFVRSESQFCLRWKCFQIQKKSEDDFTAYGAKVNRACEDCQFGKLSVDQFKCLIFILGLKDVSEKDIKTRLLSKLDSEDATTANLGKLIQECNRLTNLKKDIVLGTETPDCSVNRIKKRANNQYNGTRKAEREKKSSSPSKSHKQVVCYRCGQQHFAYNCDYRTHTCTRCNHYGHPEFNCEQAQRNFRQRRANNTNRKFAKMINIVHDDCVDRPMNKTVTIKQVQNNRKFVDLLINNKVVTFQIDTAADISIMNSNTWKKIGSPKLLKNSVTPVDAQGNKLNIRGELIVDIQFQGIKKSGRCFICDLDDNLLGIEWFELFNLWNLAPVSYCRKIGNQNKESNHEESIKKLKGQFPNIFSPTLGCCNKVMVKLNLKPDAKPVFCPKRQVPFHIMPQVEEELQRLQNSGIISPIDYSNYAAPIVIVRKPSGALRLCADYSTGLNDTLLSHHYPIPAPDKIFSTLANCSIFSQIDLSDAYLQLQVDDESRKMLTINTHRGLFTFNRLCPGVKPASGIFQQTMDTMFAGLDNVVSFFDDILIATSDPVHHQQVLEEVFRRLQEYNFKVRIDKCRLFQSQLRFLGVIIDKNGQRPDRDKTEAIQSMPAPTNVPELRSFLGAIGFYGRFIKSMSALREPLDKLLKKDTAFKWTKECQSAFTKFKQILQSDLLLTHFDPALTITLAADASNRGIGSVIYHTYPDGSVKAIHHASRRLTDTEARYSQIEKEALGIIFGMTKFHQYIFGRKITLLTDHRPLLSIFGSKKGIPAHTANRLQRWALTLLTYDFDLKFIGTKEIGHADVLSRLISERPKQNEDLVIAAIKTEDEIRQITSDDLQAAFPVQFHQIGEETVQNKDLQQVADYITNGWPPSTKAINSREVQKYFKFRDCFSLIHNCIIFRDRVVVPPVFRRRILSHLHSAHPGMSRMKALARSYVFWPGIDEDIINLVGQCEQCASTAKSPVKTTLSSWPFPTGPWERVHADFAGPVNQESYLILVDAYSKWPEVFTMTSTTTEMTIKRIREVCSRFGSMSTLVTDNAPQLTSDSFERYCKLNSITHLTTPVYHPQSNGLAEKFVDTFKRALAKSHGNKEEFIQKFLQNYRATPNENAPYGKSPAELMYGRQMRIPLDAVLPKKPQSGKRNLEMEEMFNKKHGAKPRKFQTGESVRVRLTPDGKWVKAKIIHQVGTVIYIVEASNGKNHRLHANHIRKGHENLELDFLVQDEFPTPKPPNQRPPRRDWRAVTRRTPPVLRPRRL